MLLKQIFNHGRGGAIVDPGSAGTIAVDRSPVTVHLDSAGAETRTLAVPTRPGAIVGLVMRDDGGDITLTVTSGYNEAGDTTFTFSDPGQFVVFMSFEVADDTFRWRKVSDYAMGNLSVDDLTVLGSFSGLTATVTELNAVADFPADAAVTSTADGLTTGLIGATAKTVLITSSGNADHIVTLPGIAANSLGIGHTIRGRIGATGCEIRTPATLGETINGVDADGTQEVALAANHGFIATVISATGWMLIDGAATVPD